MNATTNPTVSVDAARAAVKSLLEIDSARLMDALHNVLFEQRFGRRDDTNDSVASAIDVTLTSCLDIVVLDSWHNEPVFPIEFRTSKNGGASPRVYNALLILAEAIRLDNEQRPQK